MRYPAISFLRQNNMLFIRSFMILLLSCITVKIDLCFSSINYSLKSLTLEGHFNFDEVHHAARDFGNRYHLLPLAVLHPKSVYDIGTTIKHIWEMGSHSELTVAARGHGHSLQGQAQVQQGVVINMESLQGPKMQVYTGNFPYVDVSGGELWINILHESLFHSVLGGLGQFGIITRARISLEPAPHKVKAIIIKAEDKHQSEISGTVENAISHNPILHFEQVKWIRVLYSDFSTFSRDQEHLISTENTFDYIEGFVIVNRTGLLNNWRSSFNPQDPVQASQFKSDGRTLFCLELAKYIGHDETDLLNQVMSDGPPSVNVMDKEEISHFVTASNLFPMTPHLTN